MLTRSHTTSQNESDTREAHDKYRDTSGSATRISEDTRTFQDDSNGMCPTSSLESDVAIERTVAVPIDEISIALKAFEKYEICLGMSNLIQMTM